MKEKNWAASIGGSEVHITSFGGIDFNQTEKGEGREGLRKVNFQVACNEPINLKKYLPEQKYHAVLSFDKENERFIMDDCNFDGKTVSAPIVKRQVRKLLKTKSKQIRSVRVWCKG